MTDHAEEQEMEAEALAAIFDTHFVVVPGASHPNVQWTIDIYPEQASDEAELQELNHVAIRLEIHLPATYPDEALPDLKVSILKGLAADPHGLELQSIAAEEASNNEGLPCIYAVAERLREWLTEHNRPGLDDTSAYATMMRKQEQQEQQQKKAQQVFEAQTAQEELTTAELEELAVRKRRAEGTPCTRENFDSWKARFDAEMATLREQQAAQEEGGDGKGASKKAPMPSKSDLAAAQQQQKMTGFDYFSGKSSTNFQALEAAAEEAENDEIVDQEEGEGEDVEDDKAGLENVDEDLFDDDVDVDDLDFDDDDEDDEGDDQGEELDI